MQVKIKKCDHYPKDWEIPRYESTSASGADIRACLAAGSALTIAAGKRVAIPTGLCFEIPKGHEIQIRPRSGLSLKTNLLVVNSPGTIDSDYRGELKILMGNFGADDEIIENGQRVAQLVLAPIHQAEFLVVDELSSTERGAGGFGSTGLR